MLIGFFDGNGTKNMMKTTTNGLLENPEDIGNLKDETGDAELYYLWQN